MKFNLPEPNIMKGENFGNNQKFPFWYNIRIKFLILSSLQDHENANSVANFIVEKVKNKYWVPKDMMGRLSVITKTRSWITPVEQIRPIVVQTQGLRIIEKLVES
jgi:hypothetical protein